MCWRKGEAGNGADGAGHVAIVEAVAEDGTTVTTSESMYGGVRWKSYTRKYPYNLGSSYTFQGFIYLPIDFDAVPVVKQEEVKTTTVTTATTLKSNAEIAQEVVEGKWGNGATRRAKLVAAGYNYSKVQEIVNKVVANSTTTIVNKIAKEVIAGKWGNGATRRNALIAKYYPYNKIQTKVNQLMAKKSS